MDEKIKEEITTNIRYSRRKKYIGKLQVEFEHS